MQNLTISASICNFRTDRSKAPKWRITPETPPYPPFPKEQSSSSSSSSSSTSAPIASPALQTSQGVRISLFYKKKFFFSKKNFDFFEHVEKYPTCYRFFSRISMVFFILSSRSTRPGPILKIPANNFHEIVDAGDKTLAQNCDFYDKCKIFNFFRNKK